MPRPRTPTNVLELRGSFKHDPQRGREREREPVPEGEIGEPFEWMSEGAQEVWHDIARVAFWLTEADRQILAVASELFAAFVEGSRHPQQISQLRAALGQLGMTAADRSKVKTPERKPVEDDSPFRRKKG